MSKKDRKLAREFLFGFSFLDYVRFKNANYHIVSLGDSCLTKTLMVATGFKPRRFYGEKSYDIKIDDTRVNELVIDKFKQYDNKFTRFREYMRKELIKVISNNPQKFLY